MSDRFITPEPLPTAHERELLTILIEEAAEVQQRATKMLRFGVNEIQPGQSLTNKERLSIECGDLICLLRRVQEAGLTNANVTVPAIYGKERALAKYMQTSPEGSDHD